MLGFKIGCRKSMLTSEPCNICSVHTSSSKKGTCTHIWCPIFYGCCPEVTSLDSLALMASGVCGHVFNGTVANRSITLGLHIEGTDRNSYVPGFILKECSHIADESYCSTLSQLLAVSQIFVIVQAAQFIFNSSQQLRVCQNLSRIQRQRPPSASSLRLIGR